ncbi:MAG TPA: hypothetical protein VEL28_04710 [Candidatus Binatia bacterium]|nr:hypothetical protein [Candidatus Binatia bacterium]
MLRSSVGLEDCMPCRCDVDGSGVVSIADAARVLRYVTGGDVELACSSCGI